MSDAMESFVAAQNIAHFKMMLQGETDPDKRRILFQSLANEVAKFPEAVKHAEAMMTAQYPANPRSR